MRVGFIGLGDQGGAMARQVVEHDFPLTVWARRSASLEQFSDTAAEIAASPEDLGARSDLVEICVVDDAGVREVAEGVLAGMEPGGIIAIHSTVHPDTCREFGDLARNRGISVVDAPVSGGGAAASLQELLVMVGGDEAAVDRCLPVFCTFGNPVRYLGSLGSGQRAKLINNALMAAHLGTAHDAIELGAQLGIDRHALADVLQHGSGRSFALGAYAQSLSMAALASNVRPLLRKDVDILSALCEDDDADGGMLVTMAEHSLGLMEGDAVPLR